jgi:hypothetical protein
MANPAILSTAPEKKRKGRFSSIVLPLVTIFIGGLLMMGLTWLLYGLIFNLLESLFFSENPMAFPAGIVRQVYALVLVLLYLIPLRTRLSDLLKAILITGPLSSVMITVGFVFYEKPVLSIAAMIVVAAVCGVLLYQSKKPWLYYYAGVIAALVAIAYAWPAAGE